ncbi:MAG: hypothetical protein WD294_04830 [Phycisphaeraceae bacterium]
MAGEYSKHQRGIINRYYDNLDTITLQRLSEIVTELYLCTDAKKKEKFWQRVETALEKTSASGAEVRKILAERNVERLAQVVNQLTVGGGKSDKKTGPPRGGRRG